MAYVTVPKDLTRVKSKVVLGLTKRQMICFGGALIVGVPLFLLIRGRVPTSAAALIMVFAMLPGFLLALYAVSYTHLDVYKRQSMPRPRLGITILPLWPMIWRPGKSERRTAL